MSLKDFMKEKNASILATDRAQGKEAPRRRGTSTAPGALLAFNSEMVDAERRVQELREELQKFEGALPVRRLNPAEIRTSKWANRDEKSFQGPDFELLKREIGAATENVQPIKVRPIAAEEGGVKYELVFGQRRLRACSELGLTVNAVVQEMTDTELFLAMDRENRARADLSPYELGMHYRRALSTKLWPSQNVLSKEVGVTQAYISKLLALAALPDEIVRAFPSVLEIQVGWGPKLAKRWQSDKASVLAEAKKLSKEAGRIAAGRVFERLMGQERQVEAKNIEVNGKRVAKVEEQGKQVVVRLERGMLSEDQLAAIPEWVTSLFNRTGGL